MKTHTPKPKTVQSQLKQQRCWELYLRCWSQERIAQEIGCDQSMVSRYLAEAKRHQIQDLSDRIAEYKIDQIDKLYWILGEAVSAWKSASERPNPKLLAEARGALKDLRDLLGLDTPVDVKGLDDLTAAVAEMQAGLDARQEPHAPE